MAIVIATAQVTLHTLALWSLYVVQACPRMAPRRSIPEPPGRRAVLGREQPYMTLKVSIKPEQDLSADISKIEFCGKKKLLGGTGRREHVASVSLPPRDSSTGCKRKLLGAVSCARLVLRIAPPIPSSSSPSRGVLMWVNEAASASLY